MSPPERLSPPANRGAKTTTGQVDTDRIAGFDGLAGNRRRRAESRRMTPIWPCGCIRDPEVDKHRCDGAISDHAAEAAVDAVLLLEQLGTPALLDDRTCRAMWRVGRRDLAVTVHRRTAGAI